MTSSSHIKRFPKQSVRTLKLTQTLLVIILWLRDLPKMALQCHRSCTLIATCWLLPIRRIFTWLCQRSCPMSLLTSSVHKIRIKGEASSKNFTPHIRIISTLPAYHLHSNITRLTASINLGTLSALQSPLKLTRLLTSLPSLKASKGTNRHSPSKKSVIDASTLERNF